jgi:hypothetical protein
LTPPSPSFAALLTKRHLTPLKTAESEASKKVESESDPAFFDASDSAVFVPQEPYKKEPTIKKKKVCRVASIDIEEQHLVEFARLYTIWGNERGIVLAPIDREHTDRLLAGELNAHEHVDPGVLRQAFIASLNTIAAKSHEHATSASHSTSHGGSAMLSYFRKCLRSEIGNVKLSTATLMAKACVEQHVQEAQLTRRMQSIKQNPKRHKGPLSMDELASKAFNQHQE